MLPFFCDQCSQLTFGKWTPVTFGLDKIYRIFAYDEVLWSKVFYITWLFDLKTVSKLNLQEIFSIIISLVSNSNANLKNLVSES